MIRSGWVVLAASATMVACGSASSGTGALDAAAGDSARPAADATHAAPDAARQARDAVSTERDAARREGGPIVDAAIGQADARPVGHVPGAVPGPGTTVAGCSVFPTDNAWNIQVDGPAVALTTAYTLPQATHPHPDLGGWSPDGGGPYGIPFSVVPSTQTNVKTTFGCFADQSDPGPGGWTSQPAMGSLCPAYGGGEVGVTAYPFFTGMKIEGDCPASAGQIGNIGCRGSSVDAHALVLQQGASGGACTVWEAWNCENTAAPFTCANGAKWDLGSNASRPLGWTSADLAGLSIFAGLLKIAEVKSGAVTHAIRVTFNSTQAGYIYPATHAKSGGTGAASLGGSNPPMGLRLRMSKSVDTSSWSVAGKVVAAGMKRYGLIVADIGSDWYFQGDSDDRWNDMASDGQDTYVGELITDFHKVSGSDFEVVAGGSPADTGL